MYKNYFGFKERPFKLVPDPEYLFLSRSHEEALAHLKYAVLSGEGFVEITGEVGTGKTMLCRAFLESLDADVETAYIFNPKMSSIQLLQAVNAEFGIPSGHKTVKSLTDELNAYLMGIKAEGRRAILIIDEAQNLNRKVLEQIRLLTNLETSRDKLLQIILVGQPELGELLDSHELRQLGQRITLACRLRPLTRRETEAYIRHRLHVASRKSSDIFSRSALRRIYSYSRGFPRLINIACDRALLAAYSENRHAVSGRTAAAAVDELASRGDTRRTVSSGRKKAAFVFFSVLLASFLFFVYQSEIKAFFGYGGEAEKYSALEKPDKDQQPETEESRAPSGEKGQVRDQAPSSAVPGKNLASLISASAGSDTRSAAAEAVISMWKQSPVITGEFEPVNDDELFFELSSRINGLHVHRLEKDLSLVAKLNLPAVLKMNPAGKGGPVFLVATAAGGDKLGLGPGGSGRSAAASFEEIRRHWTGTAYVIWNNFYNYRGTIPLNCPGDSIVTLKLHLRDIGFSGLEINTSYDELTRSAVKAVQAENGIPVDGFVGPLTKIVLYNEKSSLMIPHLEKIPG